MSHLKLFSELPINTPFTYEGPGNTPIYTKISETRACTSCPGDGSYQVKPVSPSVLVFPVVDEAVIWQEVVDPEQGADAPTGWEECE
jgi:hypothetical protein